MSLHRDQTGRGLHEPALYKVKNNTGSTLTKGTVVKRTGFDAVMTVATSTNPVSDVRLGIILDDILDGAIGYAGAQGDFGQFDTSSYAAETVLYSDVTGALSTTALGSAIGTVLSSDVTNGHILFYFSLPTATGAPTVDGYINYTATTTALDITNGYVTLPVTPSSPTDTVMLYEGAPSLIYGVDFTVSGDQVQFLDLAITAEADEAFTVLYKG
jgi:hypothetical protein